MTDEKKNPDEPIKRNGAPFPPFYGGPHVPREPGPKPLAPPAPLPGSGGVA